MCRTQLGMSTSSSGGSGDTEMQDNASTTTAIANLLVCRYGSYCRGGWWYHYGRRECRGGIVCRHGPYYEGAESSATQEPTLPLGTADAHGSDSKETALVTLSPVEATYDPTNQSHGFSNLISCRFGVVCRGTWLEVDGIRFCSGALACKSGYMAGMDSEAEASASSFNYTTMIRDYANTTIGVANLLVCRYGSYCRGGWWYHYGRRECRGGIVCRHGPYYEGAESSATQEPTLPLVTADAHGSDSKETALVTLSPVEATYDPTNQSHGFSNLISCRFGVVCRGTWLWVNGVRKCNGALTCKSGYMAGMDSEAEALDSGLNFTTMMQDDANTIIGVANLLVCRYGSYCRGGWWYHYGRRECRGGIVCRHGPYYEGAESSATQEPTLPLGTADAHGSDSKETALVTLSPVEATYDPTNQSHGFSNLISCRFGVVCRGTWLWVNGVRKCNGALTCKSGYMAGVDSEAEALDSGLNFTTMMQDDANTTIGVANLLVCRYGSYCRGGWWYHYGRRECRGGIVCRHGPYYEGAESSATQEPTLPLGTADAHGSDSKETALVTLSPVEATYDPTNQSHGFSNLISCRFGVVCRGTWLEVDGIRFCSGALACKSGYMAGMDSEAEASASSFNYTTMIRDYANTTIGVANLLVCRYGSYCRGGWWYHYGRRECRGGIVCRHGPYYEGAESSATQEPTLPLGTADAHGSDSKETALVTLSPVEATYDPTNQSHGFSNLISCRFGVVCRGTWLWVNGVRKCNGALTCKSGYMAGMDSEAEALDSGLNFTTMMQDDANTTIGVANLLVCRYGSYCRGGWWYHYGRRECRGGIVCRHGPYYAGAESSGTPEPTLTLSKPDATR